MTFQRSIYRALHTYNDARAVSRAFERRSAAPVGRRVARRAYGRVTGRLARRLFG